MRRPLKKTRRNRQRGSALVVAVVMLFVIIATIELMLAAPNAELMKVKSTVAKEHAMASANAGVMDSVCWLYANQSNLTTYMSDPTSSSLAAGSKIMLTSQQYMNNQTSTLAQSAGSFSLSATPAYPSQGTVSINTSGARAGLYNFPTFTDNTSLNVGDVNANFIRFGDPIISRGEYAYRIASLGNGYYEVDVEGRAFGTTISNTSSPSKFVSRVTAVVTIPISTTNVPAALTFSNPNNGTSIDTATGANSGWTDPGTAAASATPQIYDMATGGGADKLANASDIVGTDASGGAATTSAGFLSTEFTWNTDNTSNGVLPQGTTNNPNSSIIDNIVNTAMNTAPNANLTKYTAGTGGSANTGTGPYSTGNTPNANGGITYVQIPAGATVSSTVIQIDGSATYSGLVIIDVGNNATINGPLWLKNGASGANFKGAVFFYQRGTIKLPSTGLYFLKGDGSTPPAIQWGSKAYAKALSALIPPIPKIVSYTVVQ